MYVCACMYTVIYRAIEYGQGQCVRKVDTSMLRGVVALGCGVACLQHSPPCSRTVFEVVDSMLGTIPPVDPG